MAHGDITHIDIPVADFEVSRQFYGSLFGWDIQALPGFEEYPMWQAPNKISGGGLVKCVDRSQEQPTSYVEVDSIDDLLVKVTENGGEVVVEKTEITPTSWFAMIKDPDDNVLGLYEGETDPEAA